MDTFVVNTINKDYTIYFGNDFEYIKLAVEASGLKYRKLCIISDSNVSEFYLEEFKRKSLGLFSEVYSFSFRAGEKSKTLDSINEFYDYFLRNHFDRRTVIAALGGGVTGDMAGFAAATYLRGVSFVQIPTTLLAQVDSSVGGKVGVDYKNVKNIIGSFYQPDFVYINVNTLNTLPKREFASGMAEVIKYGMIMSRDFYNFIWENKEQIKLKNIELLSDIIKKCCYFKAEIVSQDEKEGGIREILNFGHTIGHAVESLKEFEILHGECVGIGMAAVMYISHKRGDISFDEFNGFIELLKYFDIPINVFGVNAESIYNRMFADKKVRNNRLNFVLLSKIGESYRTSDVLYEEVMEALNYIL